MLPPLPNLSDYGISPSHGFLPSTHPLTRLPDPYYNKWEAIVGNLQSLILSHRLRGVVDRMPILSTVGLIDEAEWRRAYSLLGFMAHAYIWGGESPADRLPPSISIPFLEIAEHLELPPVATYAAVCLWNYKPLFIDEDIDNLENIGTLFTFTGSIDESWFYLVSVAIEARGGPIMALMLEAIDAARDDDSAAVTYCLRSFAERLTDLTGLLKRMHESCDPTVFYNRIRPFLAGSKNMAEAGLPRGVIYDVGTGDDEYRQYSGGSNAQSSLIQFFDIILGIQHYPTGEPHGLQRRGRGPPRHNFLHDMRRYMPGPHARFLEDVARVANIREYVNNHPNDRQLTTAFDACLAMLSAFRDEHIKIISRYVIIPSRQVRARSRSRSPEVARRALNLTTASRKTDAKNQKGTGGTALIPFLRQARDETGDPAVSAWAKSFIQKQNTRKEGAGDFFFGKSDEGVLGGMEDVEVKGLAGSWTMEDEVGGICQF